MGPVSTEPGFFDHLEALRRNLLVGAALFAAVAVAVFLFADPVVEFVRRPADALGLPLYSFRPQEKFLSYLRVSLSVALLVSVPAFLVLAVRFVIPALTARERRLLLPASGSALALYLAGIAFALFVVVPIALRFFASFRQGDGIQPLWSVGEYVRIFFSLIYAFSLVFQTPFLLLVLIRIGLLQIDTLKRSRRYAVLLILVVSAVVTPPDVISQLLVALPLYLLYEGTILVAGLWLRGRRHKEFTL